MFAAAPAKKNANSQFLHCLSVWTQGGIFVNRRGGSSIEPLGATSQKVWTPGSCRLRMLSMRKRPFIVALLSVFLIFVGGVTFLVLLFNGDFPKELVNYLLSQCGVTGFVGRHFGIAGLKAELAPTGLALAIIGVGLWRLSPWARTAIIIVSCVEICLAIEQVVE